MNCRPNQLAQIVRVDSSEEGWALGITITVRTLNYHYGKPCWTFDAEPRLDARGVILVGDYGLMPIAGPSVPTKTTTDLEVTA